MRACWLAPFAVALIVGAGAFAAPAEAPPSAANARAAVERAIPLIEKGAAGYTRQRGCFSCHHQAMGVFTLTLARERGYRVDEKVLAGQVAHTEAFLRGARDGYRQGRAQGGGATTAGYALWTLQTGGWKADETTAAVAGYLLQRDAEIGHWRSTSNRPPTEASPFTTTYFSLRAVKDYAPAEQQERVAARVQKVREWLVATPAHDTEDRVFRLWGLQAAGADAEQVKSAARQLLETQREDGGWSQTGALTSDAYATGSALVALHQAGAVPVTDPGYQRGAAFLVRTQAPDGSWHVVSRSKPFQPYFESGFPHGKDQWISMAATCWATAALALLTPAQSKT